ncbi:MAG: divalent-cation tolerance protein CutA [Rickettsiales bacterium]|jgi:periplasmic divalent cation tolerance protein|nr:divalent-cation tolerance protein CutA [Rickettsiales bacterium]
MKENNYCIIFSTAGSAAEADKIAAALIDARAAACVQMTPITSLYRWKGAVEREPEIHLMIKTRDELYDAAAEIIRANHSYETPQIVRVPITDGLPEYLDWIRDETGEK